MLFKNKGISDATVLRIVSKILKECPASKGFRVNTPEGKKTLTHQEIIKFIDALAVRLEDGRYGVIRRCDTCGNFSRSGKMGKRGSCFPKVRSLFRSKTDYCSGWIPMNPEQKYIKEKVNEHFKLQTKRAGDGSKDSNESNRPAHGRKA